MASTVQRDCICRHFIIVVVVYYLWLLEKLKLNRWQTSASMSGKGKGGGQKESKQDHPHKVPLSPHFTCMITIFPLHRESLRFCAASFPLTLLPTQTFSQSPDASPSYEKLAARHQPGWTENDSLSSPFISADARLRWPFLTGVGWAPEENRSVSTWQPDRTYQTFIKLPSTVF